MTLHTFLDIYIDERALRPESERQLRMSVGKFIDYAGDLPIDSLSHAQLNAWQRDNPAGWSPKTMKRRMADVLAVWTYAYRVGVTENLPDRQRVRPVRVPAKIPESWTIAELQTMLAACERYESYLPNGVRKAVLLKTVVCVGFYTALRAADLFCLHRKDLSVSGVPVQQQKKRGDDVLVVVPEWVIEMLNEHYPADVELVVAWPYRREHFYAAWKQMLRDAGLPYGPAHGLQKLRRTAISYGESLERGFGSTMAGHATQKTTYRHYVDPRILRMASRTRLPDIRCECQS